MKEKGISGILLPKLLWSTVIKTFSSDWEKLLKFEAKGREFAKFLRLPEQFTYSKSERSEQFLKQNACSWKFLIYNKLEKLKLEKKIGI